MTAALPAPVGIVLVNWNRWQDTIECLESVFRSSHPVRVVVVDNASADGSMEKIAEWARGERMAEPAAAAMAPLMTPPVAKPLSLTVLDAEAAHAPSARAGPGLTLAASGGNLGFAGGNNVGLRLLQAVPEIDCFWLLNNDTVIAPDTVAALAGHMAGRPEIGLCGTVVRFYHQPNRVQVLNGSRFSPLTGQSAGIGFGRDAAEPFDAESIARQTDFVLGASLAVSRRFLDRIGLMEDRYFLYYEEIDWAVRNRRHRQPLGVGFAAGATVWHKEGGSIGSSSIKGARSNLADYWLSRSRLAFTRTHYPWLLPAHWALTMALVGRRLLRGQPSKAKGLLRALFARPYSP
ncbi:glycosyltransferase family 2 protein [Polymorphobacter sp.]|uniref:glycosyltransferase family 2 protein n=1 Tax=Polymorphobacter sp. TaxID=1909290 RepID=UPI003F6E8306